MKAYCLTTILRETILNISSFNNLYLHDGKYSNCRKQTEITSFFPASKTTKYECPKCFKIFWQKDNYDNHMSNCTRYHCHKCNKTFLSQNTYNKHKKTNCPPRRFPCPKCTKSYARSSDRDHHTKTCNYKDIHRCVSCKKVFLIKSELSKHQLTCLWFTHMYIKAVDQNSRNLF